VPGAIRTVRTFRIHPERERMKNTRFRELDALPAMDAGKVLRRLFKDEA
jgi:hypothetical protein